MKGLELPRVPKTVKEGYIFGPVTQTLPFINLIFFLHYKQTADPKDKSFSVYGFAKGYLPTLHGLPFCNDDSLDLLRYAIPYTGGSLTGAPSWVPDWSRPPVKVGMDLRGSQPARDSLPGFAFSADGQTLTVAGIHVDEIVIRERPSANYQPIDIDQYTGGLLEVFPVIRDLYAQIRARYEAGESAKEALFQTNMSTSALDLNDKDDDLEWFRDHFGEWFLLMTDETLTAAEDLKTSLKQFWKIPGEGYQRLSFMADIEISARGEVYFVTEKVYTGQSVYNIEPGDVLVVFAGMTAPCVIRRMKRPDANSEESSYFFLGPAYAHGIMDGELWDEGSGRLEEFTLI